MRKFIKALCLPLSLGFLVLFLLDVPNSKHIQLAFLSVIFLDLTLDALDKYQKTGSKGDFAIPIVVGLVMAYMAFFT